MADPRVCHNAESSWELSSGYEHVMKYERPVATFRGLQNHERCITISHEYLYVQPNRS
ncbi:hypothetical protein AKJ16_DCAP22952 [Drosera capensis]